jgi:hypothetical protein
MALSEVFPPETSKTIERPGRKTRIARTLIPITARELVEWTYAVQRAQGVPEPSLEPQGRSQTGIVVDRMIEFAQLGCRVDVSSNAAAIWGEAPCHEDAITVHELVRGMPFRRRALVIRHGSLRSTPEWDPRIIPLRCVPVPGRKGKPKGIYSKSNHLIGHEVTYEGDWPNRATATANRSSWINDDRSAWRDPPVLRCADQVIGHARAVYSEWIESLAALANWLDGTSRHHRLRRYRVHGVGAPFGPWRTGGHRPDRSEV